MQNINNLNKFKEDIKNINFNNSDKESLVQQIYDKYLSNILGTTQRKYKCDAYYEFDTKTINSQISSWFSRHYENPKDTIVRLLCEYKYDLKFSDRTVLAKTIIQVISYLRTFQKNEIAPSTILIGDVNEIIIMHSNWLIKYTNFPNINWNIPPSSLANSSPELLNAILQDEEFNSLIIHNFIESNEFNFTNDVIFRIFDLTANNIRKVAINEGNIMRYSEFFMNKVIADKVFKADSKKMAAALYQALLGEVSEISSRGRQSSTEKSTKFVRFGNSDDKVLVNKANFDILMNSTESEYSRESLMNLTGVFDRLIEDTQRRRDGKFYTPAHLCEAARAYADKYLGEDWRTRGIVWDCASGTCNLTKGVYFRELYVSTLDQEELDAAELSHSIDHRFTTAFKYDFLNDPYEKLPENLRLAIENGVELTFFVNPPYGSSGGGIGLGANKDDVNDTVVNNSINEDFKLEDLLMQFMYKMINTSTANKINIIIFGKTTWMTGPKYKKFRKYVNEKLNFKGGFVVNSKEFSGNAEQWPLTLSIFSKEPDTCENEYIFNTLDRKYQYFAYSSDTKINDYAKMKDNDSDKIIPFPHTTDALNINTGDSHPKEWSYKNVLGFLTSHSNSRNQSSRLADIWSMTYSNGHGLYIYPENFVKCCEVFTARVLSKPSSYLTDREEYSIPNTALEGYEIFSAASLIMAIFMPEAKSTSVELDYKGKHFVIKNHFFWLTKLEFQKQVMNLEPLEGEPDEIPYMVTELRIMICSLRTNKNLTDESINIVSQGLNIINQATELLKDSYPYREEFSIANPIYQLQHWDAGFKQLKPFWESLSNDNETFKAKYEKFMNDFMAYRKQIRPMVWKFGFLKGEPEE